MNVISLEKIIEMWEKDSVIDETEPGKEIIRIPVLHSKYVQLLTAHSLASKQAVMEYSRLKKIKYEYYNGKMDADELKRYGWEPFKFLLKSDLNIYLDADRDLAKLLAKKTMHEEAVSFCNSVIKELTSRTYQLRAYMDWEKFIQGAR